LQGNKNRKAIFAYGLLKNSANFLLTVYSLTTNDKGNNELRKIAKQFLWLKG